MNGKESPKRKSCLCRHVLGPFFPEISEPFSHLLLVLLTLTEGTRKNLLGIDESMLETPLKGLTQKCKHNLCSMAFRGHQRVLEEPA